MNWVAHRRKTKQSGTRYTVALVDRWGTARTQQAFRAAGLRRFADALNDAIDGHTGRVHEYMATQSASRVHWIVVNGDKFRACMSIQGANRLLQQIDELLGD